MVVKLTVSHEFTGFSDYWGGNGRRWDDNAGCLFAFYDGQTTLRDCVDQWVDEFCAGGDCDSFPAEVTGEDVRAAILDSLTRKGRADYESGALAECAADYAAANGPAGCRECGETETHAKDCQLVIDNGDDPANEFDVEDDDRDEDDDYSESPVWVILVECETCSECGKADDHAIDDICEECAIRHGYTV